MNEQSRDIITLAALSFFGGVIVTLSISNYFHAQAELERNETKTEFVWNDDEESIPTDGSLVRIEFTEGNTIYIGPAE
jgi:hypothetical protein